MLPHIDLFGLEIQTYGLLMVAAFVVSTLISLARGKNRGLKKIDIFYMLTYLLLFGLIGSKLLYWLTVLPDFIADFGMLFTDTKAFINTYVRSGLVYYGGFIGAFFGGFLYCRQNDLRFSPFVNVFVPVLPIAHAIGRVGCFCAGCCYGRQSDVCGVVFPDSAVARLPVQLYEAGANLIIAGILFAIANKKQKRPVALGWYSIMYAVVRFGLEYLRADEIRGFILGLSTSQFISVLILLCGVALLIFEKPIFGFVDNVLCFNKKKHAQKEAAEAAAPDEPAPDEPAKSEPVDSDEPEKSEDSPEDKPEN